jgi:hypothetical protein
VKFALDHVVIAVRDLSMAITDYQSRGFNVYPGGRHPAPRTSSNALIIFEDGAYIELISWDPPNPAERWSNLLQAHGEGFVDFALMPEDLPRAVEAAKSRGLMLNGPLDGKRLRPDGVEVRWQTARQATFDLPFLCADVTPRELRVPGGEARVHANGKRGIAEVSVAVRDLDASIKRYEALLGVAPQRASPGATVKVGTTTIRLEHRPSREGPEAFTLV